MLQLGFGAPATLHPLILIAVAGWRLTTMCEKEDEMHHQSAAAVIAHLNDLGRGAVHLVRQDVGLQRRQEGISGGIGLQRCQVD